MTSFEIFALKNRMLFYNIFTMLISICIIIILSFRSMSPPFYEIADFAHQINKITIPLFLCLIFIFQLLYEIPIRKHINSRFSKKNKEMSLKAKQRLLNAPLFIIGLDLSGWIIGAVIYAVLYSRFTEIELAAYRVFFQNSLVGLVSVTAVFFILEQILQKSLVPNCFPDGGLYATPKTKRIRIGLRFTAFIFAVNLIPFFALLLITQGTYNTDLSVGDLLKHLQISIITCSIISISIGICLTILMNQNITRPISEIISVLKKIHTGNLNSKVAVTTNDEIGYTGDVINEMTDGLKERERLKNSISIAQEVQQLLLPKQNPKIPGLDIAGQSIYCEETGGDYYDFLRIAPKNSKKLGVVVGDVSGHGVGSALFMSMARALLRLRSVQSGTLSQIVTDVNRELTLDLEDSGQFMTLFYLTVDQSTQELRWIRAGHEPAIVYDRKQDSFGELRGSGIPLGIDSDFEYKEERRTGLGKNQIILIGTDGLWESKNTDGKMFGKESIYTIFKNNAEKSANEILSAILEELNRFQRGRNLDDDITVVIIKILT